MPLLEDMILLIKFIILLGILIFPLSLVNNLILLVELIIYFIVFVANDSSRDCDNAFVRGYDAITSFNNSS